MYKFFIIFVLLMLAVSAVSAEENQTDYITDTEDVMLSVEPISDEGSQIVLNDDEVEADESSGDIVGATEDNVLSDPESFYTLENLINTAGTRLVLDNDYVATSDNDIYISGRGPLVIEGNGHVIDFNGRYSMIDCRASGIVFNNITFKNAQYGTIDARGSNSQIINCEFIFNYAPQGGAVIWRVYGGLIENVTFINNTAGTVGALVLVGSNNLLNNVTFINNSATVCGALGIGLGLPVTGNKIKNSIFYNNSAVGGYDSAVTLADNGGFSGAVFNSASGTTVENCIFEKNNAHYGSGGGFYTINAENVLLNNCSFISNNAIYAAGVYLNGENLTVNNSYFEGNNAYDGAGAYMLTTNSQISNSTFKNNHAIYGGGAITGASYEDSSINNCIFENNSAGNYGGALSIWKTLVENNTFKDNTALFGAAVYTVNSTVKDSNFTNNKATIGGDSIFAIDECDLQSDVPDNEIVNKHNNNIVYASSIQEGYFINLTNGYAGFCAELFNSPPSISIQTSNMTIIRNSNNHKDVSEYLKILFYVFVEHIDDVEKLGLQHLVWVFTHDDYENSTDERIIKTIELYDEGFRVNSTNAVKLLKNGSVMIYNFSSLVTPVTEQNMFIFKYEYQNFTNQTVDKKALNKTVFVGDEFQYQITVTNRGNETLNDVYIEDVDFSSNMQFLRAVNGNGSMWKYSNDTIEVFRFDYDNLVMSEYRNISSRWVLTTPLAPGKNATIILVFKALRNGTAVNNVTTGFDDLWMDNSTNNETRIYNPNFTVEKITMTPVVEKGSLATFKIIVTNTGDFDLKDVFVVESSYSGLEYDSFNGVNWTKTGNRFNYLETLKVGENASFEVTFKVLQYGNLTNVVVAGSNKTNNKTTNNTTHVLTPDLEVSKITLNRTVRAGEEVSFDIIVKNTGEVDLENVFVVESKYDSELVYRNYVSQNGNWKHGLNNEGKHMFTLDDLLKVGESASFRVIFIATASGNFTNTVIAGYNNTTTSNSTNITEVVNKTIPENKTIENKTVVNKTVVNKTVENKTTENKTLISQPLDKTATGNPLILLLMALAFIPIRRFRK